jgi:[ribosomal protein S5]-alanine N-acetyltransferase
MLVLDALLGPIKFGTMGVEELTFDANDLRLRVPLRSDFAAWAHIRAQSHAFLRPWEPIWPADDLTEAAFRRRLKRYYTEIRRDESYPFFIFSKLNGALMGGITIRHVRRASADCATLGYWMGEAHAGKGIMTRAVDATCRFAFSHLRIVRMEAACLPENTTSIRVLEKAGFEREGYARSYLVIAGMRRDHVLFARLADDCVAQGGGKNI